MKNTSYSENLIKRVETAKPLSEEEYAKIFISILPCIEEYDSSITIVKKFIENSNFDGKLVDMLSIGAGTGNFEERIVRELNVNLNYIYAIEPNEGHVINLQNKLTNLDVNFDVDTSYFSSDYELDGSRTSGKTLHNDMKFDIVLISYSINCFNNPCDIVNHASKFLRAGGKILIIHQGESAVSEVYSYLLINSDPQVFSADKTISDMSMTDKIITSGMLEKYPELDVKTMEEPAYTLVDDFIRNNKDMADRFNIVSLFLQANFLHLSEASQKYVYDCISNTCSLIDNRYYMCHPVVGIIVSRP